MTQSSDILPSSFCASTRASLSSRSPPPFSAKPQTYPPRKPLPYPPHPPTPRWAQRRVPCRRSSQAEPVEIVLEEEPLPPGLVVPVLTIPAPPPPVILRIMNDPTACSRKTTLRLDDEANGPTAIAVEVRSAASKDGRVTIW